MTLETYYSKSRELKSKSFYFPYHLEVFEKIGEVFYFEEGGLLLLGGLLIISHPGLGEEEAEGRWGTERLEGEGVPQSKASGADEDRGGGGAQ